MLAKPHLVLLHSFPTNSVLLRGLEEFLADYFDVHFIDLPGFNRNAPLDGITLKKFANYLDRRIAELEVEEYIVGGVSFGFLVINHARLDERCRAILAMEPFLNADCLNISFWKRRGHAFLAGMLKLLHLFGMEDPVWRSEWFSRYLKKGFDYPEDRIRTIIRLIDAGTFFAVAQMLMTYRENPKFHDLPHFLIGNFTDKTINFDKTVEVFISNLAELHLASEPIDHYPKELTKSYFKTRIPPEHINRMLACIEGGGQLAAARPSSRRRVQTVKAG